jgi:predicted phage gp36 major capsid-like protein
MDLKKIGDTLPVSEEFGEDEASAAAELDMFINVNIQVVRDAQLATGAGTGDNMSGIMTQAPAYTAVASGIVDANIYDLVKKVRTDIVLNRGSKYMPNFVAMNANTIDRLQLKKDANKGYIFPDKTNIGAMEIIEDNNIPDNQLVVGDSRYGRIYEKGAVTLSRDYVGTGFVEDMVTIKGRKRMLFLIRNVDRTGFRKVTDITAALTTLAT